MRKVLTLVTFPFALPSTALACASCLSSAFGDRTYTWPYYALFAMPFLIAAVVGGVLAYSAGVRPRAVLRALRQSLQPIFEPFQRSPRPSDGLGSHRHAQLVPPPKETT